MARCKMYPLEKDNQHGFEAFFNNKRVVSTFKFGYPHLTLKQGPKVKSDHIKRFLAHGFL